MSERVPTFSRDDATPWIAVPSATDDKYARGVLGLITGSSAYPGAALLGAESALRTGLGMLRYYGTRELADSVLALRPEAVTQPGRVQAWALGSGIDESRRTPSLEQLLNEACASGLPCVLDAGALDLIDTVRGPCVITPHARELARILNRHTPNAVSDAGVSGSLVSDAEISADPVRFARLAARMLGVTVLLKGSESVVASHTGRAVRLPTATPWLATAGTGDVLAGILGALVATHSGAISDGDDCLVELSASACTIHALAAEKASGGGPLVAFEVASHAGRAVAELLSRSA